jgi:hypothetical protein
MRQVVGCAGAPLSGRSASACTWLVDAGVGVWELSCVGVWEGVVLCGCVGVVLCGWVGVWECSLCVRVCVSSDEESDHVSASSSLA